GLGNVVHHLESTAKTANVDPVLLQLQVSREVACFPIDHKLRKAIGIILVLAELTPDRILAIPDRTCLHNGGNSDNFENNAKFLSLNQHPAYMCADRQPSHLMANFGHRAVSQHA